MSHGNAATFPRLADVIGFITPDQLEAATKAVLGIHRDFGDRTNRKHARLKYVIAERGVDWFRAELESRIGAQAGGCATFPIYAAGRLARLASANERQLFLWPVRPERQD